MQLAELVGLVEHPAPVTLLLEGLVRSHRSRESLFKLNNAFYW